MYSHMRTSTSILCTFVVLAFGVPSFSQTKATVAPSPTTVTMTQLRKIESLEGRLIAVSALVRHTDTAQVFTFGEKDGAEVHVVIPYPAVDAANVGDTVAIIGFVRRFSSGDFERDYSWFRRADYPHLSGGDLVIVATSVRTPEGTELVPPNVISNTSPAGKTP
jgi:hypothetical protein